MNALSDVVSVETRDDYTLELVFENDLRNASKAGAANRLFLSTVMGYRHYQMTPYSFNPKIGNKLVSNDYVDLGQGLFKKQHSEGDLLVSDYGPKKKKK